MSERDRKRAFAVCALCIAGVVAALSLLGSGGRERRPAPAAEPAAPPVATAARPSAPPDSRPAVDADGPASPAPQQLEAARDEARAFVDALLRLEVGDRSPRVRRALRRGAGAALARRLLARPPAGGGGRLVEVDYRGAAVGGQALFAATIDRGGRPTTLLLTLRPERGRWVVTDVG